ncbi:MAG: hypothetical protein Kow0027_03950 [Saprospiraceae bacterium]
MDRKLLLALLILLPEFIFSQTDFGNLDYRFVGPYRGGRSTAVAGVASQPGTFYMGATGGGVWKTEDYGVTWKNISDGYFKSPSIGAIRVAPSDPNVIYVGTGSDGLRSNIIRGDGMYKSIDAGRSWQHIGLKDAGLIGAVEINPYDHNICFVAAIGQPFQPNPERGVFRTKDGGRTWEKVLFLSDTTGFADLEFMPSNPNIIYAAAWRAERKPWTIISGGRENGIYKSVDGGDSWTKLTNGLPTDIVGKIDLAVSAADSKVLYALVEAPDGQGGLYRSDDQGESFRKVSDNRSILHRPFYFCNITADPTDPEVIYAQALRLYKSADGGKNWRTIQTPHGDDHDLWINPGNPQIMIEANDGGANVTTNGGRTWSSQFNQPTAELYQVEVDDQYPYWLYAGQQDNYTAIAVPSLPPATMQLGGSAFIMDVGGCETGPAVPKPGNPDIVYSNCKGRFSVFNKKTGQEQHYDVGARNMYGHNPADLTYRFQRVSPIHVSPHDPNRVYHCSQYVHLTTNDGKSWMTISPDLTANEPDKQVISGSPITRDITGEEFYSTIYAIRESEMTPGLIWVGANDGPVHVTRDGGKNWKNVTPKKLAPGGRVDAVEPSPHDANKAYIAVLRYQLGDWKPYIFKTENLGESWTLLTPGNNGLPEGCPTRVVREDLRRAGLLFAGTDCGMFISFDDGKNWEPFQQNLPVTPVTDIKVKEDDLVLSTMGRGFWIMDNISPLRQNFESFPSDKPVLFAPAEQIRRRSVYGRGSEAVPSPDYPPAHVDIDYYLPRNLDQPLKLIITSENGKEVSVIVSNGSKMDDQPAGRPERDMATGEETWQTSSELKTTKGFHRFRWDMSHNGPWQSNKSRRYRNGPLVAPGHYTVRLLTGTDVLQQELHLRMDPRLKAAGVTEADLQKQEELSLKIVDLISAANKFEDELKAELKGLQEQAKREPLSPEQQARKSEVEGKLKLLVNEEGPYPQNMLLSQIRYLYGVVSQADQLPGLDTYVRYDELKKELETLMGQ